MIGRGLDGPRMPPANGGRPAKLVIFAHGYGSNGQDLIGLAPYWARLLPDTAFVAPNAPESVPGYPEGRQWFAIGRTDPGAMAVGVQKAGASLDKFIDAELTRYGLPASAIALVGFSQGTMMALHVGLQRAEPIGAVIGFSGLYTGAAPPKTRPPVLLVHGDQDERIPVDALLTAATGLADAGVPSLWRISLGAGHTIAEDGLALGGQFLADAFAGKLRDWAPPSRRP